MRRVLALAAASLVAASTVAAHPADAATGLSFAGPVHFAAGNSPWLLATGDVLGNGRADLAVANIGGFGPAAASLLLNTTTAPGAVSFAAPIGFAGSSPQATLLGDFTGDHRPELVVCDEPGLPHGRCSVYPNLTLPAASSPTFGPPVVVTTGSTPEVVKATDMNGDGRPDLVVANFGSFGPAAVSVALNTSHGGLLSFAATQYFAGGAGAEGLDVADLNGDGRPDLITGNTAGNNVTALVNLTARGSNTVRLATPQAFPATAGATSVVAADINRDGRPDLAVGSSFTYDGKDLNIYLNATARGATTLHFTHQVFVADPGIEGITAADFDGSGRPSIAYAAYRTQAGYRACVGGGLLPTLCKLLGGNGLQGDVGVMQNTTPRGSMVASFASPIKLVSGPGAVAVVSADFDGDGQPDIAAGNFLSPGTGGISIFTNQTRS